MLEPAAKQPPSAKRIIGKATFFVIIGMAIWIILLIHAATRFEQHMPSKTAHVAIGPLTLNTISKEPLGSGYRVSVSLEPGLLGYLGTWMALGLLSSIVLRPVAVHEAGKANQN